MEVDVMAYKIQILQDKINDIVVVKFCRCLTVKDKFFKKIIKCKMFGLFIKIINIGFKRQKYDVHNLLDRMT